jgi:hypothetical protein
MFYYYLQKIKNNKVALASNGINFKSHFDKMELYFQSIKMIHLAILVFYLRKKSG